MAAKSKKKQRATPEQGALAPIDGLLQRVTAHAQEKPTGKGKGKNKKGKPQSATANGALVLADREPNGRLPEFVAAALRKPDANVQWPVLLLRHGLLLVVEGIDARYGIGQQRSEADVRDSKRGGPSL
jgi:hypothetical protein